MREKSTSIALVTCAAESSERRMCSAMPRRVAVIGSTVSPGSVSPAATGAGAGGFGAGAGARAGGRRGRLVRGWLRLRCRLGPGRRRLGPRRFGGSLGGSSTDLAELRPDVDGLALLDEDLRQRSGGRTRHLGVDLVGGDLEQRL